MYWGEVVAREQRPHIFATVNAPVTPRTHARNAWHTTYGGDFANFHLQEQQGTQVQLSAPLASTLAATMEATTLRRTLGLGHPSGKPSSQQGKRPSSLRTPMSSRPQSSDSRVLRSAGRAGIVDDWTLQGSWARSSTSSRYQM
eukprot:CAMPEP_0178442826 /NCGR_PEP_ID=MMETSP0689_2-20121128/38446_1 /TAXON_ID=160604 /ORGANISM="Amphidinium massartii, Strain CS-259" /LENGTH=142 /DNA_ID=CAMNT_0020066547 /DNA_START=95 /DNA_END=520 /DNA_ORIENTATION=+